MSISIQNHQRERAARPVDIGDLSRIVSLIEYSSNEHLRIIAFQARGLSEAAEVSVYRQFCYGRLATALKEISEAS